MLERITPALRVHDLEMEVEPWDGPGPEKLRGWKLVTGTTPARETDRFDPEHLKAQRKEVVRAFTKWWTTTPWGRRVRDEGKRSKRRRRDTSYIMSVEVAPGGMVHWHALVYGEFVPQPELQERWERALGVELAVLDVRRIDGDSVSQLREVVKYVTKSQGSMTEKAAHLACIEIAFRGTRSVMMGGAIKRIRKSLGELEEEEGKATDCHDELVSACEACGSIGEWKYSGPAGRHAVEANGGFGVELTAENASAAEARGPRKPRCSGSGDYLEAR